MPGFTEAKIKALGNLRQAWLDTKNAQSTSIAVAQTARGTEGIKQIEDRRVAIQLAADAEWSHAEEANAGIRGEFGLSPKRSMSA